MNHKSIKEKIYTIIPETPIVGIILGSGLGAFTSIIKEKKVISYSSLPDFPQTSTKGHSGEWVFGYINHIPIIVANGRFHYYEGFSLEEVASTVSTIHALGCDNLIITNAAGCLNLKWNIGEFMLIKGYLDYTFRNNSELSKVKSFANLETYGNIINKLEEKGINVNIGNYAWTLGPSYETYAEIKDLIINNISAVGMSTVPELMKADKLGMNIMGVSCLTNYGAGLLKKTLTHKEILQVTRKSKNNFLLIIKEILNFL
tara:strand:- start:2703 stop:3479 length:777 start_codon:yes stop_codon:yes gene_type:complete